MQKKIIAELIVIQKPKCSEYSSDRFLWSIYLRGQMSDASCFLVNCINILWHLHQASTFSDTFAHPRLSLAGLYVWWSPTGWTQKQVYNTMILYWDAKWYMQGRMTYWKIHIFIYIFPRTRWFNPLFSCKSPKGHVRWKAISCLYF